MSASAPSSTSPLQPSPVAWGAVSAYSPFFPALTGLRGLAAVWVLLFHSWQFSGSPQLVLDLGPWGVDFTFLVSAGYMGVDLFFVLSGFLLAMPFHSAAAQGRPRPRLGRFWIRRARRVLPAYWVQLAILVALGLLLSFEWLPAWAQPFQALAASQPSLLHPLNVIQHILLVQNLSPWQFPYINAVYWSMPVEWDFYVLLPLLAWLLLRGRWWLVLALMLISSITFRLLCHAAWFEPGTPWPTYPWIMQLPSRLDEFFFGVLAAWLYVYRPGWILRSRYWLIVGALAVLGMAWLLAAHGNPVAKVVMPGLLFLYSVLGAVFAILVVGAAAQSSSRRIWFAGRVMTFLGVISYSLYLWHYPLLQVAQTAGWLNSGEAWAMLRTIGVTLVPIVLVAWLSWRFVERPFLLPRRPRPARPVNNVQPLAADAPMQRNGT